MNVWKSGSFIIHITSGSGNKVPEEIRQKVRDNTLFIPIYRIHLNCQKFGWVESYQAWPWKLVIQLLCKQFVDKYIIDIIPSLLYTIASITHGTLPLPICLNLNIANREQNLSKIWKESSEQVIMYSSSAYHLGGVLITVYYLHLTSACEYTIIGNIGYHKYPKVCYNVYF